MIYFIGAGPGAADLITVKGKELLEKADLVIYAGSLVNPELLKYCKPECTIMNSATMTLEEVIAAMVPVIVPTLAMVVVLVIISIIIQRITTLLMTRVGLLLISSSCHISSFRF